MDELSSYGILHGELRRKVEGPYQLIFRPLSASLSKRRGLSKLPFVQNIFSLYSHKFLGFLSPIMHTALPAVDK